MATYWVKFKLADGADVTEVSTLAQTFNQHFACSSSTYANLRPNNCPEFETANQQWMTASENIKPHLHLPLEETFQLTDTYFKPPISNYERCRISIVALSDFLPLDWRRDAYRMLMPHQLRDQYQKWSRFATELEQGKHQAFLQAQYLYTHLYDDYQQDVFEHLHTYAVASKERSNKWANREPFQEVRDTILASNLLSTWNQLRADAKLPTFDFDNHDQPLDAETAAQIEMYQQLRNQCATEIRAWNRHVPSKQKHRYPMKWLPTQFPHENRMRWFKLFLAWCQHLVDKGYGLFVE